MCTIISTQKTSDLGKQIWESVSHLDKYQQIKLLEFINSLSFKGNNETNLLKYAGYIDKSELELMKTAISDCAKIDQNEW